MKEEGGGGYIAYVWDCAYWGTQIKLSQFTNNAAYASEVPQHKHLPCHPMDECVQLSFQINLSQFISNIAYASQVPQYKPFCIISCLFVVKSAVLDQALLNNAANASEVPQNKLFVSTTTQHVHQSYLTTTTALKTGS